MIEEIGTQPEQDALGSLVLALQQLGTYGSAVPVSIPITIQALDRQQALDANGRESEYLGPLID